MGEAQETQDEINAREWSQPINWSGGWYSSRLDTRLWVPKQGITGAGLALNFGHPQAKVFIAGLAIVPAVVLLAVVILIWFRR